MSDFIADQIVIRQFRDEPTPERKPHTVHWWNAADADFTAWLGAQPEHVQELDLLEQIEAYAGSSGCRTCEGGGWEDFYGPGGSGPNFRECHTCHNPEEIEKP
jgi:hypothetical protein